MANIFGEGQNDETEIFEKLLNDAVLCFVFSALQQFHIGLCRNIALFGGFNESGCLDVTALYKDENIGIKYYSYW